MDELRQEHIDLFMQLKELIKRKEHTHSKIYDSEIAAIKIRLFEIQNILRENLKNEKQIKEN